MRICLICMVNIVAVDGLRTEGAKALVVMVLTSYNIGLDNGLVPSGNKPLPEPMLIKIYVAIWHLYMHLQYRPSLVQIMACRLFGTKPLSEPMLVFCQLDMAQVLKILSQVRPGPTYFT